MFFIYYFYGQHHYWLLILCLTIFVVDSTRRYDHCSLIRHLLVCLTCVPCSYGPLVHPMLGLAGWLVVNGIALSADAEYLLEMVADYGMILVKIGQRSEGKCSIWFPIQ